MVQNLVKDAFWESIQNFFQIWKILNFFEKILNFS
jgi:hypothetical protein